MGLTEELQKKVYVYMEDNKKHFMREMERDTPEVWIDLSDILSHDIELYEALIELPEDITVYIRALIEEKFQGQREVRYYNTPETERLHLHTIQQDHVGRFISTRAMVKRKSDRLLKDKKHLYLCTNPSCSYSQDTIGVSQIEEERKLRACPKCKSSVEFIDKETTNYQTYVIEELTEEIDSNIQPKAKLVELEGSLTLPHYDTMTQAGSKVEIAGVIKERKKKNGNKTSTLSEFFIEGYSIRKLEEDITDINLTFHEKQELEEESKREDLKERITEAYAPYISGMGNEKLGIILSILGGSKGGKRRDRSHILLVGDAGRGKTDLINFTADIMPRAKISTGEGSTGIGLTASVVKDEFTGNWMPEAGALVKANNGYLILDELDKVKREDVTKLNTGMETGKVYIDKVGVSAEMNSYTTVIASANPKNGRFKKSKWNQEEDYINQIPIDSTLLSRFDLTFLIIDEQNEDEDERIARQIFIEDEQDETWEKEKLSKYLLLAKSKNPKHTKETQEHLINYYKNLRKKGDGDSIIITNRQIAGLKRLSEAHAKLYLRSEVTVEDCEAVISLMEYSQKRLSESEILTKMSNSTRGKHRVIRDLIEATDTQNGFTIEDIEQWTGEQIARPDIEKVIEHMKNEVIIYENPRGTYRRL